MDARVYQSAVITGRIRDALRRLGYAVPAGTGPGTPAVLAAMAPVIAEFAERHAAAFKGVAAQKDPLARAAHFAAVAEAEAQRVSPGAAKVLGALAAGFVAYRGMKKAAGGQMENLTLSDMMKLINTTMNGLR